MSKLTGTPYRYLCGDCRDDWHLRAKCTRCHGQGWLNSEEPVTVSETTLPDQLGDVSLYGLYSQVREGVMNFETFGGYIVQMHRASEREALERAEKIAEGQATRKLDGSHGPVDVWRRCALKIAEAIRELNKSGDTGS